MIGYINGKPVFGQVIGKAATLEACVAAARSAKEALLEDAPAGARTAGLCVAVPEPTSKVASANPKPADNQKEATL